MMLDTISIDPLHDARWLDVLEYADANIFHSRAWLGTLTDTYGFPIRAYIVTGEGSLSGGIPYCQLDDLMGARVVALPFTDACDPVLASGADTERIRQILAARLTAHHLPLQMRLLENAPLPNGFTVTKTARWHRLSVAGEVETLWAGLSPAARRAIRKARKEDVEIRPLTGAEGVDGFVRLHIATRRRKYGMLAQPARFFHAMMRRFEECRGWYPLGAFCKGELIAATIYLRWKNCLYYKFNASAAESLRARPNNLLLWEGVLLARALGCEKLDLGPSDDDQPGLIRFKRETGASESELRFVRWTPPEWQDVRGDEVRRLIVDLTGLFAAPDTPESVGRNAADMLYKYFA